MKEEILRIFEIIKGFPLSLDVLTVLIKTNPKDLHRHYPFSIIHYPLFSCRIEQLPLLLILPGVIHAVRRGPPPG